MIGVQKVGISFLANASSIGYSGSSFYLRFGLEKRLVHPNTFHNLLITPQYAICSTISSHRSPDRYRSHHLEQTMFVVNLDLILQTRDPNFVESHSRHVKTTAYSQPAPVSSPSQSHLMTGLLSALSRSPATRKRILRVNIDATTSYLEKQHFCPYNLPIESLHDRHRH